DIQDDINTGGREGAQNGTDNFYIKLDGIWSKYEIQNRKLILTHEERNKLIKKQENLCPLCNGLLFNGDDIEIDHIKPLSVGGRDTFLNLQATHKDCNRKKRNFYKNT
ncbi:HNH endonuclease, partial [Mesobacillus zeae]